MGAIILSTFGPLEVSDKSQDSHKVLTRALSGRVLGDKNDRRANLRAGIQRPHLGKKVDFKNSNRFLTRSVGDFPVHCGKGDKIASIVDNIDF